MGTCIPRKSSVDYHGQGIYTLQAWAQDLMEGRCSWPLGATPGRAGFSWSLCWWALCKVDELTTQCFSGACESQEKQLLVLWQLPKEILEFESD